MSGLGMFLSEFLEALSDEAKKRRVGFSFTLVNQYEAVLLQGRIGDNVKLASANIAELKAKQAARCGESTRLIRDGVKNKEVTPDMLGIDPAKLVVWAGGHAIYDEDGVLRGGMGISNLTEDEDEAIAHKVIVAAGFCTSKDEAKRLRRGEAI